MLGRTRPLGLDPLIRLQLRGLVLLFPSKAASIEAKPASFEETRRGVHGPHTWVSLDSKQHNPS